jgi:hypothetical protein
MQTLAENDNNDLYIDGTGNIPVLTAQQALAQSYASAIEVRLAEMEYAQDQGMPWFQTAFNSYNPIQFEAAARNIIDSFDQTVTITAFTVTKTKNVLSYVATIETIYGTVYLNG